MANETAEIQQEDSSCIHGHRFDWKGRADPKDSKEIEENSENMPANIMTWKTGINRLQNQNRLI